MKRSSDLQMKYGKRKKKSRESIQAMDHEVYGTLKIACASIVGQNWLPQVLKKFVLKYPYAKISPYYWME